MADVRYSPEEATTTPLGGENVRQEIRANPDAFGAATAEAAGQFGGKLSQIGGFYDKVAADTATTSMQRQIDALAHGDPNEMIPGPNGQMIPKPGYFSAQGFDKVAGYHNFMEGMDSVIENHRNQLSPQAQLEFDRESQRIRSMYLGHAGTVYDQGLREHAITTNTLAGQTAMNLIMAHPDDETFLGNAIHDLAESRVKTAALNGATEDQFDSIRQSAVADATKARIEAIGATDPGRALKLLDTHKDTLGENYPEMKQRLETHWDNKVGEARGQEIWAGSKQANGWANPALPIYQQAASVAPGGMSPTGLARTIQIESAGKPLAANGSHAGLGQFGDKEWAKYGGGAPKSDPNASIVATARYSADNAAFLRAKLGRAPTDAELYLAHQQGAGGALALLNNPFLRAGDVVPAANIKNNGGDPNAPCSAFTSMWVNKFNSGPNAFAKPTGAPPPQPATPEQASLPKAQDTEFGTFHHVTKTDAAQAAMNDPNMNWQQKVAAMRVIEQNARFEEYAYNTNERQKHEAQIAHMNRIVMLAHDGAPVEQVRNEIWNPNIPLDENQRLLAEEHAAKAGKWKEEITYGSKWNAGLSSMLRQEGDPDRIFKIEQIFEMEKNGDITHAGANDLIDRLNKLKSKDYRIEQMRLSGALDLGKDLMTFDQENLYPGVPPLKDQKGKQLYEGVFLNSFLKDFEKWKDDGKPIDEFLDKENVKKYARQARSEKEMAQDRISAERGVLGGEVSQETANKFLAPPEGVPADGWKNALNLKPEKDANGVSITPLLWAAILKDIKEKPSEEKLRGIKNLFGVEPSTVLEMLNGQAPAKKQIAPEVKAPVGSTPFLHEQLTESQAGSTPFLKKALSEE